MAGGVQAQIHGKELLLKVQVGGQTKNLVVLRRHSSTMLFDAHLLVETFNKENGTGLKVVSHKVAGVALTVGDTWMSLPLFPVDTSIAYEKPGTRLDKEIVFSAENEPRVVLATGKFKGERDVALVSLGLTSADFVKDGNSIVLAIPDNRLILVPNLPGSDGWYMLHEQTGVPHGGRVGASQNTGYLRRLNDSSYLGLLVRFGYFNGRQFIYAYCRPSSRFGVVVEVPDADIAKIEEILRPLSARQSGGDVAKIEIS